MILSLHLHVGLHLTLCCLGVGIQSCLLICCILLRQLSLIDLFADGKYLPSLLQIVDFSDISTIGRSDLTLLQSNSQVLIELCPLLITWRSGYQNAVITVCDAVRNLFVLQTTCAQCWQEMFDLDF